MTRVSADVPLRCIPTTIKPTRFSLADGRVLRAIGVADPANLILWVRYNRLNYTMTIQQTTDALEIFPATGSAQVCKNLIAKRLA